MGRVDVLNEGDLKASCRPLTRDDGRVCKEILPDLGIVISGSIIESTFGNDLLYTTCSHTLLRLSVRDPIPIPSPERS